MWIRLLSERDRYPVGTELEVPTAVGKGWVAAGDAEKIAAPVQVQTSAPAAAPDGPPLADPSAQPLAESSTPEPAAAGALETAMQKAAAGR